MSDANNTNDPGSVHVPANQGSPATPSNQSTQSTINPPHNLSTKVVSDHSNDQAVSPTNSQTFVSTPQQALPSSPKKSKLPFLIGACVVILLLIGSVVYAVSSYNHKSSPYKAALKSTSATPTHTTTTANACGVEECFSPYFKNCQPATLNAMSSIANVKYQIYGKKGNGCSTLFEYTSNPNPAWVNQPMICNFDNSKVLDDSVAVVMNDLLVKQNTYGCTGPLVKLLQNQ